MSILVNKNTRVVVQGITGKEGSFHATQCKAYGTQVVAGGTPTGADVDASGKVCRIELDLGLGDGAASYLASDLSYDYVRINADYRT